MGDRPPQGYVEPISVWLVEFLDSRQPGERFQAGAFTTQEEAQRLLEALAQAGGHEDLCINLVPVHARLEDWEWDR